MITYNIDYLLDCYNHELESNIYWYISTNILSPLEL